MTIEKIYHCMGKLIPFSWILTFVFMSAGLYGAWIAPADYQQGEAFRILYVHVPCAFLSLFIYMGMAICSLGYLIWRVKLFDIFSIACAPIGALFTFLALVTGSIWGKPMWGTWWIWDARLTSELILLFLYLGYMGLYNAISDPKIAAKSCAVLALVGALDIPIIHFSVNWFQTLHQGATISKLAAPSIATTMLWPLVLMLGGFTFYFLSVFMIRARWECLDKAYDTRWVKQLGGKYV